jgi:hypothetical protein
VSHGPRRADEKLAVVMVVVAILTLLVAFLAWRFPVAPPAAPPPATVQNVDTPAPATSTVGPRSGAVGRENRKVTDFTSARAKLDRAAEHYQAFQTVLDAYLASQPVSLVPRPNPEGNGDDYYVALARALPPELNTIFGDCVHNLRAVLDHTVQALAVANGGDPNDRTTAFPICRYAAEFAKAAKRHLKPLSDQGRSFIESLQPYNRQGRPGTLFELRHLDDRDKHRAIVEHRLELTAFMEWTDKRIRIDYAEQPKLADGAFYATVRYDSSYDGPKATPPIIAAIAVERSNLVGFIDARNFLRDEAFPFIRAIVVECERGFLATAGTA